MASGPVDPARLSGRELDRWYRRTPQEIEAERQAAENARHGAFVASIRNSEREPEGRGGPDIPRPNTLQSFIPVVGPAWEAAADFQDGNYAGAAFNGAMAVADVLPLGVAVKGVRAATKGIGILKKGSVTAGAAAIQMRRRGMVKTGEEVHHTIPLKGASRSAQDPRNHFALLKVLPKEQHRRLTGSWGGKPRYDPIRRVWYGTTDWQKAIPTAVTGYAADAWENLSHPFLPPVAPSARPRR